VWEDFDEALFGATASQKAIQGTGDPVTLFLESVTTLLNTGRAYVSDIASGPPAEFKEAWGWEGQSFIVGEGDEEKLTTTWRHKGQHIGWTDGSNLYLMLKVALGEVQKLACRIGFAGEKINVTERTLGRMMFDRGFLLSADIKDSHYTTRKNLQDNRPRVLHLAAKHVIQPMVHAPDLSEEERERMISELLR
jgi:hypothetical protein